MDTSTNAIVFDGLQIPKEDVYRSPTRLFKQSLSYMRFFSPSEYGLKDLINEKKQIIFDQFSKWGNLPVTTRKKEIIEEQPRFINNINYSNSTIRNCTPSYENSPGDFNNCNDNNDFDDENFPAWEMNYDNSSLKLLEKHIASYTDVMNETDATEEAYFCKIDPTKLLLTDIDYLRSKAKWYYNHVQDYEKNPRVIERIKYLEMFTQCFTLRDFNSNLYNNNNDDDDNNIELSKVSEHDEYEDENDNDTYNNCKEYSFDNYDFSFRNHYKNIPEKENDYLPNSSDSPVFKRNTFVPSSGEKPSIFYDVLNSQTVNDINHSSNILLKQDFCVPVRKTSSKNTSHAKNSDQSVPIKKISKSLFTTHIDSKNSSSKKLLDMTEIAESVPIDSRKSTSRKLENVIDMGSEPEKTFNSSTNYHNIDHSRVEKYLSSFPTKEHDTVNGCASKDFNNVLQSKSQTSKFNQFEDKGTQYLDNEEKPSNINKTGLKDESSEIQPEISKHFFNEKQFDNNKSTNTDPLSHNKMEGANTAVSETTSVGSLTKKKKNNSFSQTIISNVSGSYEKVNEEILHSTLPLTDINHDTNVYNDKSSRQRKVNLVKSDKLDYGLSKKVSCTSCSKVSTVRETKHKKKSQSYETSSFSNSDTKQTNLFPKDLLNEFLQDIKEEDDVDQDCCKSYENDSKQICHGDDQSNNYDSANVVGFTILPAGVIQDEKIKCTHKKGKSPRSVLSCRSGDLESTGIPSKENKISEHLLHFVEGDHPNNHGKYEKSNNKLQHKDSQEQKRYEKDCNLKNNKFRKSNLENQPSGDYSDTLEHLSVENLSNADKNENYYILKSNYTPKKFESELRSSDKLVRRNHSESSDITSTDSSLSDIKVKKYKKTKKVKKIKGKNLPLNKKLMKDDTLMTVSKQKRKQSHHNASENVYLSCWKRYCVIL